MNQETRAILPFTDDEMSMWMGADPAHYEHYVVVSFARRRPDWWNAVYVTKASKFVGGYAETSRGGWYILMGFEHD